MDFVWLLVGLALLTGGGDTLVRGAVALAARWGVSPLLAGLVIVGFGTSSPELVVSLQAAMENNPDIALGNVIGSNIANILLILGLCGLVLPLTVHTNALNRDGLAMVVATVLALLIMRDGAAFGWGNVPGGAGGLSDLVLSHRALTSRSTGGGAP